MSKGVNIMVLGATGYTGKCVVKFLANITKEKYWDVSWGIAGRSKEKLEKLVVDLNKKNFDIKHLTIVEVDIENEKSLKTMLQDVKIVINCTGPNVILSPPIVKACIETGTHYLDISAEMLHILRLYQDYYKKAEDANVLIIPGCGFAAIPAEIALIYLERQFKGTLHSVECYTQLLLPTVCPGRAVLHNGTWTSVVYVMETLKKHKALKNDIFPKPIEPEPEGMKKSFFHRKNGHWWFPFPGIEDDVIEMSERYLHEKIRKKPVHFKTYTTCQIFFQFIVIPVMFIYYYLCYFKLFRKLLINYPRLCTAGLVSEKGPSDKIRQDTKYYFTLNGKGWDINDDLSSEPTKTLSVKVSGNDPGYDTTAITIVMCAITILKEGSKMPSGGVIMPGAAFYNTDIADRLGHEGLKFEVLDNLK